MESSIFLIKKVNGNGSTRGLLWKAYPLTKGKSEKEEKRMSIPFEGGCHCGAVRYVVSEDPITIINCHCGDCQKIAGAPFITGVFLPEGSVKIDGQLTSYMVEADSGNGLTRSFCPKCGTRILVQPEGMEGIAVSYTSLDDNTWLEPEVEFYTNKAQPWVTLCEKTQKLSEMT